MRRTLFKLVEKVLKGESVLWIQFISGAKGNNCNQFVRKETEMEIVCRKFAEQCPWDPHLWSSEGSRSWQRDSLNCDADVIEVSGQSHRMVLQIGSP